VDAVSKDAVDRLIEVLQEMVKRGTLQQRDFGEAAYTVKLARAVASPSDEEYNFLVSTIFNP
jgi:hypothetical protein